MVNQHFLNHLLAGAGWWEGWSNNSTSEYFHAGPRDLPRRMPRKRVRFAEAVQFAPPVQEDTEEEYEDNLTLEEHEGNLTQEDDEDTAAVEEATTSVVEDKETASTEEMMDTEDVTEEESNPAATTEEIEGSAKAVAMEVEVEKKDNP